MRADDKSLKMYDRVIYNGKLCIIARANGQKVPNGDHDAVCIEYVEKFDSHGWSDLSAVKSNVPGDYKSSGSGYYWNLWRTDEIELVSSTATNPLLIF